MRIDKTQRPWIQASIAILIIAVAAYVPYALLSTNGPRGGSALGLIYGLIGYAMMLFAALLGARKKRPIWRLGRAQTWMRGHLWFGLLSFPIILMHAGFAWRGPLTSTLMILFIIVWISGIFGALIQHYLPRVMMQRVPLETIYEEIPHVRQQLRDEADQLAASICGPLDTKAAVAAVGTDVAATDPLPAATEVTLVEIEVADRERFRDVYVHELRPFLEDPEGTKTELAHPQRSAAVFESMRRMLPAPAHAVIDDLESICEEERQLIRQRNLYRWLHGWLIVHVPLSIVLVVLGGIHAIVAVTY